MPAKMYPHGDYRRYNSKYADHRCRCDQCRAAHRDRMARFRRDRAYGRWQPATIDATGTRRRLQALTVIGWPLVALAPRVQRGTDAVEKWMGAKRVSRATAQRVADLYEELSGTPGPHKGRSTRARNNGWASPIAWEGVDIDDPAAQPNFGGERDDEPDPELVRRALTVGVPLRRLNDAEKAEVWRNRGARTVTEMAALLHLSGASARRLAAAMDERVAA